MTPRKWRFVRHRQFLFPIPRFFLIDVVRHFPVQGEKSLCIRYNALLHMRTSSSIHILYYPYFLNQAHFGFVASIAQLFSLPSGILSLLGVVSLCPYNKCWPILVDLRPGDGAIPITAPGWTIQLAPALKTIFLLVFALFFSHATLTTRLALPGPLMRRLLDIEMTSTP